MEHRTRLDELFIQIYLSLIILYEYFFINLFQNNYINIYQFWFHIFGFITCPSIIYIVLPFFWKVVYMEDIYFSSYIYMEYIFTMQVLCNTIYIGCGWIRDNLLAEF